MSRLSLRAYAQAYLQATGDPRLAVAAFDTYREALERVPGLRGFLANTAMPTEKRREALAIAVPNQSTEVHNLFLLLAHDKRLRDLSTLGPVLRQEAAAHDKKTHAIVTSAIPLPAPSLRRINAALTRLFQKDVWLESQVDPTVIAGLRVQVGDWVFDATRHGRLLRLEDQLQRA